ncbi:acylphosphatase [Carboxylicivirga taeanensis]|uniref:acylphosphatase n=1 Tax=Carboxylicivirga taeanensis TaxID=1416875 RepID=UPI003F6DCAC8
MKRVRVIVDGRVQGVGFRYFVADGAKAHNINGYVQNLPDGKVEIDAEGECENLHHFLHTCKKGPAQSRVDTFMVSDIPFYGYRQFKIKRP